MSGIGSHTKPNNGISNDWITPPEIIRALGPFDLDPCCPPSMPWRTAATMLTSKEDGLSAPWDGFVWLNPPYGEETSAWLAKMKQHNNGIALTFARTETKMFFDYVWDDATCIFFFEGRLYFYDTYGQKAKGNAGGPSVLIGYGEEARRRIADCPLRGAFLNNLPYPQEYYDGE